MQPLFIAAILFIGFALVAAGGIRHCHVFQRECRLENNE